MSTVLIKIELNLVAEQNHFTYNTCLAQRNELLVISQFMINECKQEQHALAVN